MSQGFYVGARCAKGEKQFFRVYGVETLDDVRNAVIDGAGVKTVLIAVPNQPKAEALPPTEEAVA